MGMFVNRIAITRLKNKAGNDWFKLLIDSNEVIATRRGTAYEEYVKQIFPNATIKTYVEWEDVIDSVIKGEVTCAFYDEIEIKKLVRQKPDLAIKGKTVVIKDMVDPIAIAVSNDNVQLWQWLNFYLSKKKILSADDVLDMYDTNKKNKKAH